MPHENGITWQAARYRAAVLLDAWHAEKILERGIDPATLAGAAALVPVFEDAESWAMAEPDPDASFHDHSIVIRALVQEARKRWGFRFVPLTLRAPAYRAWLAGRPNSDQARKDFLVHEFAKLAL